MTEGSYILIQGLRTSRSRMPGMATPVRRVRDAVGTSEAIQPSRGKFIVIRSFKRV